MRIDDPHIIYNPTVLVEPMVLVSSSEFSTNVSTVDFTLPLEYGSFLLKLKDIVLADDSADCQLRVSHDGGATFNVGSNYAWCQELIFAGGAASNPGDASDTRIPFNSITAGNQLGNAATEGLCADLYLYHCNNPSNDARFHCVFHSYYLTEGTLSCIVLGDARHTGTNTTVSAIRILSSGAGGIDRGNLYLWGIN